MLVVGAGGAAKAEASSEAQIKALQAQIDELQRTVKQLAAAQAKTSVEAKAAKKQAGQAEEQSAKAQARTTHMPAKSGWWTDADGHGYFEHKPGNALTFYTPGGEITGYGQFDVSIDATTKNAGSLDLGGNTPPVGNFGWMPAISTNISYLGIRGFQRIGDHPFNFVYQFEAGIDISAAPGLKQSNSNLSNQVNGALFSRNSYIGFASPNWGAIKVGKTDAPYKNSTAEFNPFSGQIGDYAAVMGNSGGDNRVEFGTRINHAIWYESPKFGGFQFNVLFAPGQNRSDNSDNLASGESDCAGGNDPNSGANPLASCSDGAFSNAVSTNLSYTNGPLYMTAAYEFHQDVNRQSDIVGAAPALFNGDVADEDAAKIGVMYKFPTKTTVGAIYEHMHRYVPAGLDIQNERSRDGTWLVVSQELNPADSLHFGWAHAFRSPGNPGQHNDSVGVTVDGVPFGLNNNQADMLTLAYKHKYTENLIWYTALAATFNGPDAHYDLGAGGRGVTTDCHDANAAPGGINANPHCFTGTTLLGVSTGVQWKF